MMPMKKQDFDIICRKCKATVAGEVLDRGHICYKVNRVLQPPSFLTDEEKRLQWKLERILLEYANDHRIEQCGEIEGWVLPSIMSEVVKLKHKQERKFYYIGLFDGLDVDEYGEKRMYTQSDISIHIHMFKEKALEKINNLFVHTLSFPRMGITTYYLVKKDIIDIIKGKE